MAIGQLIITQCQIALELMAAFLTIVLLSFLNILLRDFRKFKNKVEHFNINARAFLVFL